MILYSNGCSYTAHFVLDPEQRYPYLLADKLKWKLHASAIPGSSNRRIIRCTIRDCIKLLNQPEPVFAMIQLSHMSRTEFSGIKIKENQWKYAEDDLFESINGPDCPDISALANEWGKTSLLLHDERAEFTRLMSDIIAMTAFFKQHNIDYMIFTGPKIHLNPDELDLDVFYQYLKKDYHVLDLLEFNMLDLTGKQIHPDIDGMQLIADYFLTYFPN